jgi:hypothetical protein
MQHGNLKVDFQNDFTNGYNLHLLDKYSKTIVVRVTQSEGTSFVQRSGRGGGNSSNGNRKRHEPITYDKKYLKDKECYKCHKKGHPATHCPKKRNGSGKDNYNRSLVRKASSVRKMKKDLKSMKKALTTVNTQFALLKEANYDNYESEGDKEASHSQVDQALQFTQVDNKFNPRITNFLNRQDPRSSLTSRRSYSLTVSPL